MDSYHRPSNTWSNREVMLSYGLLIGVGGIITGLLVGITQGVLYGLIIFAISVWFLMLAESLLLNDDDGENDERE